MLKTPSAAAPAVIALLRHYERVGFSGAPRVVGTGFADDGRLSLAYVPGTSAHPRVWPRDAHFAIGALLRQAHDAAASFHAPPGASWEHS